MEKYSGVSVVAALQDKRQWLNGKLQCDKDLADNFLHNTVLFVSHL